MTADKIDVAVQRELAYATNRFTQATRASSLTFALAAQKVLWTSFAKLDPAATAQMFAALSDLTKARAAAEIEAAETRRRHAVAALAKAAAPTLIVRATSLPEGFKGGP